MKRPSYRPARFVGRARPQRGLTLVELMVAMVLGLLILGGVVSIFLSNRQAFRTSEQLARIQENARTAFELMSRSIREAGAVPCGSNMPVANVLKNASTQWWSNWGDGIRGYHGKTAMPVPRSARLLAIASKAPPTPRPPMPSSCCSESANPP